MPLVESMQLSFQRYAEFEKLCNVLRNKDLQKVADDANVSVSTLYHWVDGKTQNPHINTLAKVAYALGYKFKLVKGK